ncbi:hypothetical protein K7V76_003169 [Vibrio fluvialis]|nr:hypothetical protein [Vibrio fluvialis]EKO3527588.1 hypothetical protein [Vibrio fluvialis]ELP3312394.1 hypothetical protein [Vibrio fluvialis]
MANENSPAAPTVDWDIKGGHAITITGDSGLTKYEEILARFMSAMLSNPDMRYDAKGLVDDAKLYADAYFEHLETKNPA